MKSYRVAVFTGSGHGGLSCEGIFTFVTEAERKAFRDGVGLGAGCFGGDECACWAPEELRAPGIERELGDDLPYYLETFEHEESKAQSAKDRAERWRLHAAWRDAGCLWHRLEENGGTACGGRIRADVQCAMNEERICYACQVCFP